MASRRPGDTDRPLRDLPFFALRETLREGYRRADLRADAMAGAVVALVAVPLAMALAINSGVPPQHGLYTAIVAGLLIAVFGGSRWQVSGPTAAFVVLLAPVAARYGLAGLACASLVAGVVLIAMGLARLGRAIEFIPYPVTTGFTAGIAVVIATTQVRDFLGLDLTGFHESWIDKVFALGAALPTWRLPELAVGVGTLVLLVMWPRVTTRFPAPLVALPLAAVVGIALRSASPEHALRTIGTTFSYTVDGVAHGGIPAVAPTLRWPWEWGGPGGAPLELTTPVVEDLMLKGLAIALLGAIESLLSAVVADGIRGTRHDPDAELLGQGIGNLVAPFFGGFAATGALARTATNIRSGARSPFAAVLHALLVLAAVLLLAPTLSFLPMAALAALLLRVAWQMSEARHFVHTLRIAPRSDVLLLLACFGLTVVFDMTIAVGTGVLLAALLFMRRMAEETGSAAVPAGARHRDRDVPPHTTVFHFSGPLFFGSAGKATRMLRAFGEDARVVVLDLTDVPVLDATGLANLEVCIERMRQRGTQVVVGGVRPGPLRTMVRAGWRKRRDHLRVRRDLDDALEDARELGGG